MEDGFLIRDLTPLPHDLNGANTTAVGTKNDPGLLAANCDLTTIANGVYDLILSAEGGRVHDEAIVRFRLESNLKIGQFSFSQQDLVIPVKGIPLSVVRTYNSLKLDKGDFGVGWTYAIMDMDVVLDETRQEVWGSPVDDDTASERPFSQRVGGYRDVTLTLPTGQRTTFYFNYSSASYGSTLSPEWSAALGTPAGVTLTAQGNPRYLSPSFGGYGWMGSGMDCGEYPLTVPEEAGDFIGFVLTMPDRTQYIINREDLGAYWTGDWYGVHAYGKPYLAKIAELAGDIITIDQDGSGITYSSPGGDTKRITFDRRNGLITGIHDLVGGPEGLPVV